MEKPVISLDSLNRANDISYSDKSPGTSLYCPSISGTITVSERQHERLTRHRLTDILSALPKGSQKRIAYRCRCSPSTVSKVLNGMQSQSGNVAELMTK